MNTETEARYADACSALISNLVCLDCKPRLPWLQGLAAFILALTALKTTPFPQNQLHFSPARGNFKGSCALTGFSTQYCQGAESPLVRPRPSTIFPLVERCRWVEILQVQCYHISHGHWKWKWGSH